jgi:CBS domain-containing protein
MKVADVMTKNVQLISPDQTLREAAHMMSEEDIGAVPVSDHDRLVGMVTDRDITIRGVALGKWPEAKVKEVMSEHVKYCFEDEDIDHVSKNMASIQMRRLPVMDRDKRLVSSRLAISRSPTEPARPNRHCAAFPNRSSAPTTHR